MSARSDRLTLQQKADVVNAMQASRITHPLACGICRPPQRDEFPLVAVVERRKIWLTCPLGCGYRQLLTAGFLTSLLGLHAMRQELDAFASRLDEIAADMPDDEA